MTYKSPSAFKPKHLLGCTALTAVAVLASAASAEQVRLTTATGNASIEGDLVSYEDGIYTVETIIGQISIADEGIVCEGPGCPGAEPEPAAEPETEVAATNGTPGERVVLSSNDGSVRIEGTLVSYANGTYTIDTVIGSFDVEGEGKTCEGPGCPTAGDSTVVASVTTRLPTIQGAEETPQDEPEEVLIVPDEPEQEAVETAPEPEPEPVRPAQIQLALMPADTPEVTIAGPASVLDGLLPALASLYAESEGQTAEAAEIELVDPAIAAAAGYPSGRLASIISADGAAALSVVGQLTGTASEAIGSLNSENADIALSTSAAPMMLVRNRTEAVLGNEALVAVVSPANGVFQLTPEQLAQAFAGEISNWQELGGEDRPLRVFGLPNTHDLSATRDEMLLRPFRRTAREPDQVFPTEAELAAALNDDPSAIGLVSHNAVGPAKPLSIGSSCGITTAPTPENIRTARYPFSRSLVAISFAAEGPAAKVISAVENADDGLVTAAGLEPVTLTRFEMSDDEAALRAALPQIDDRFQRLSAANALRIIPTSERLGTILTFDGRSNRLDTRSKAELERILDFIGTEGLGEVVVAGHVGTSGDTQTDKTTARGLAAGVRRAMEDADTAGVLDQIVVRAVGIGSVMPLECSNPEAETTLNRRAEIWVRR